MNLDDLSKGTRVLISAATLTGLALTAHLVVAEPFADQGIALTAVVDGAGQGLTTSSPIKLRGVTIGRVEKIELAGTSDARLTLRFDPGVRVPDSATAAVEPESVFGPKFVDLVPGEHEGTGPFLADGQDIERTAESGDLNQLLVDADAALAAVDPADIAVIFDTLSTALAGQGDEIRGLVDHTAVLAGVAHEHRENAKAFIEDLARLARIRGIGEDIGTVVDSGATTLETLTSGQDRGKRTAAGTSSFADTVTGGFTRHKDGMTQGVRSAERAVALLSGQLGIGGPAIRTLDEMLPIYRALGFPPIGEDKRMLAVNIVLPSDPCQMFLGVCPADDGAAKRSEKPERGR